MNSSHDRNSIEEQNEIGRRMLQALDKSRGYADFFSWAIDRDLEEWGVVTALNESLSIDSRQSFEKLKIRGRRNDPPDLEAKNSAGERVAVEVTELVDSATIKAVKNGQHYEWADWDESKFVQKLNDRITAKDPKFLELKDPPYPGGYYLVIHCDEPDLKYENVLSFVKNPGIIQPQYITSTFIILSFDPRHNKCPYVELPGGGDGHL